MDEQKDKVQVSTEARSADSITTSPADQQLETLELNTTSVKQLGDTSARSTTEIGSLFEKSQPVAPPSLVKLDIKKNMLYGAAIFIIGALIFGFILVIYQHS